MHDQVIIQVELVYLLITENHFFVVSQQLQDSTALTGSLPKEISHLQSQDTFFYKSRFN